MELELIHSRKPTLINPNFDKNKWIVGHCKCPVDTRYGLVVSVNFLSSEERKNNICRMYCSDCDTYVTVGFNSKKLKE